MTGNPSTDCALRNAVRKQWRAMRAALKSADKAHCHALSVSDFSRVQQWQGATVTHTCSLAHTAQQVLKTFGVNVVTQELVQLSNVFPGTLSNATRRTGDARPRTSHTTGRPRSTRRSHRSQSGWADSAGEGSAIAYNDFLRAQLKLDQFE